MSEDPVATRAPENDAAEDSPFPGDSVAQEGPSMGEHCVTDRPTPDGEAPSGELTKIKDIDVYVTKPADYPHSSSKLLLMLTGGTGVKSINNQLQADKYASEGFLVVMPDQFGGDPARNSVSEPLSPTSDQSWLERKLEEVKLGLAVVAKSSMIDMWLARHTPSKVLPILYKVIDGAKEEYADAIASGGGIYCVGYCFGAKYALLLGGTGANGSEETPAKSDEEEQAALPTTQAPLIKAASIAHGTQIAPEDISNLKVPTIMVCVQDDPLFPNEVRTEGIAELEKNGLEHEVKVYPEVPHGFAVFGDYDDPKIKEAQRTAFGQMLGWLQAH